MTDVFERIFGPPGRRFLNEQWPRQWLHAPAGGDPRRLGELRSGEFARIAADLRALDRVAPGHRVEVFDNIVGSPAYQVSAEAAHEALWERGQTIRLRRVDAHFPVVGELMREVVATLAPHTRVRQCFANLFVSPPGWRCVPHFDGHEVIVLNLFGRKSWRFAAQTVVEHACVGFELGSRMPAILQFGVSPRDMPQQMPDGSIEVTLEPGDALFLPRGFYHQTHAHELSLQVTLSLLSTTRAEATTQALFRRLVREPIWRSLVQGLSAKDPGALRATSADLVDRLAAVVAEARTPEGLERFARDLFEAQTGPAAPRYRVDPFAELSLRELDGAPVLSVARHGFRPEHIQLQAGWVALVRWLLERAEPFTLGETDGNRGQLSERETRAILRALHQNDVVWCAFGVEEHVQDE